MAVQVGEGSIEIIYGSTSIPAGALTMSGYISRPDSIGEWPVVVIFGPEPGPTSSISTLCRVLARHGIAAVAPSLTASHEQNADLASRAAAFITDPSGSWSNAKFGYGVLAFGAGIYDAASLAAVDGRVVAVASVSSTWGEPVVEQLQDAGIPGLWIGSKADETVDVDASTSAKEQVPQTTFVIHPDAQEGFWDEGAEGYESEAADDTRERIVRFFSDQLPPRV